MVCGRCIRVVREVLAGAGWPPLHVGLGEALLSRPLTAEERERVRPVLAEAGFELLDDRRMQLVDRIRTSVIELVHYTDLAAKPNLSDWLRERCRHDYSYLSKLFSEVCGISIERYYIAQKIERAKELLVYDELSVGEIADRLHYSSAAHLSAQFRAVTGMPPSAFRRLRRRTPLDEV